MIKDALSGRADKSLYQARLRKHFSYKLRQVTVVDAEHLHGVAGFKFKHLMLKLCI